MCRESGFALGQRMPTPEDVEYSVIRSVVQVRVEHTDLDRLACSE